MSRRVSIITTGRSALMLAYMLLAGGLAEAHKVSVFASVEGRAITGYAYLSRGDRLADATVRVFGPGETLLGEVETDEKGEFVFNVQNKCDHRLILETQDGHRAEFLVEAGELPEDLPELSGEEEGTEETEGTKGTQIGEVEAISASRNVDVEEAVGAAVAKQIRPLREEINRMEQKIRLHDVLGGIGYIFGIAGAAFYFLGVRRKADRDRFS